MEPTSYSSSAWGDGYSSDDRPTHRDFSFAADEPMVGELNDLFASDLKLLKPIPICLEWDNQMFVCIQEDINLWGEASSLSQSEKELARAIVELYHSLSSMQPRELGPYPREVLSYLKRFIKSEA